jgi:hypothetical protein
MRTGANKQDMQGASLRFVAQQLFLKADKHKNPKVLSESVAWLTSAGLAFGANAFESKWAIATAKAVLQHSNAAVRKEGIEFATMLHQSMGSTLSDSLQADLKPAMMKTVQESFDKADVGPPTPSKQERAAPKARLAAGVFRMLRVRVHDAGCQRRQASLQSTCLMLLGISYCAPQHGGVIGTRFSHVQRMQATRLSALCTR